MIVSSGSPVSRTQRYVRVGRGFPVHAPGVQVSVSPTASVPETSGGSVFVGPSDLAPGSSRLLPLSASVVPPPPIAVATHHSDCPHAARASLDVQPVAVRTRTALPRYRHTRQT